MIKKFTLLVVVFMATTSFAQTELLTDPGFETTADILDTANDWYTSSGVGAINSDMAYVNTGSKSGNLVADPDAASNLLHAVDLVAGKTYKVEFYMRDVSDGSTKAVTTSMRIAGVYQQLTVDPDNTVGGLSSSCNGCNPANAADHIFKNLKGNIENNWQKSSFFITAASTDTYVIFIQHGKNDSENIYVDDVSIKEDGTASIDDLKKFNFSYAPNPAKDQLRLSAANPINEVKVFNMLGQEVLRRSYNEREASVDVSNLIEGVYVMKVNIGDSVGTFRIIKE